MNEYCTVSLAGFIPGGATKKALDDGTVRLEDAAPL